MRNFFLLILISLSLFSCTKSDDSENQLTPNYENMAGNWDLTSIILADGSIVSYQGRCSTMRDNFKITIQSDLTEYHYGNDCSISDRLTTSGYYFEGRYIKNANGVFYDSKIVSLTSNSIKLEYDNVNSYGYFSIYSEVKGAILTKTD